MPACSERWNCFFKYWFICGSVELSNNDYWCGGTCALVSVKHRLLMGRHMRAGEVSNDGY